MTIDNSNKMTTGFRRHKIGRRKILQTLFQKITKPQTAAVIGFIILIFFIVYGFMQFFNNLDLTKTLSLIFNAAGKDLKTDRYGNTNILLLGVGGEGHEGKDLTDSIILANINHAKKTVSVLSIPRDMYVERSDVGGARINKLFEIGIQKYESEHKGLELVRKTISELFEISLPYAVKIDFQGFEKVIDELDGIDVFVEETIDDPFYPDENFGNEPFYLPAGNRHLDGKTALKYVRSRKTSSDFDRSKRQQQVLLAIRDKAEKKHVMRSPRKLKNIFNEIEDHVTTNMDLRELITLAGMAPDLDKDKIFPWNMHDDPVKTGGFLYAPVRELYGGAFVLLPASDDWFSVKKYFSLIFNEPAALSAKTPLQILNGTKTAGLAGTTKTILQRFGFYISRFGNARIQGVKQTVFYYKTPNPPEILKLLSNIIPAKISAEIPREYMKPPYESDAEVVIELGEDFVPIFDKLDVFRNIVEMVKAED